MADELTDLVTHICLGDEHHTEVPVETLKAEKYCYTYRKDKEIKEFRGRLISVVIGEKYSLPKNMYMELKGLTDTASLRNGVLYNHGSGLLGMFFPDLIKIE